MNTEEKIPSLRAEEQHAKATWDLLSADGRRKVLNGSVHNDNLLEVAEWEDLGEEDKQMVYTWVLLNPKGYFRTKPEPLHIKI